MILKALISIFFSLILVSQAQAHCYVDKADQQHCLNLSKEADYVNALCRGQIEYRLSDRTRVDCLTETDAAEYDFARKWAESIGQSLHYAKMTGRKAKIVLIKKKTSDERYVQRAQGVIERYHLPIMLQTVSAF